MVIHPVEGERLLGDHRLAHRAHNRRQGTGAAQNRQPRQVALAGGDQAQGVVAPRVGDRGGGFHSVRGGVAHHIAHLQAMQGPVAGGRKHGLTLGQGVVAPEGGRLRTPCRTPHHRIWVEIKARHEGFADGTGGRLHKRILGQVNRVAEPGVAHGHGFAADRFQLGGHRRSGHRLGLKTHKGITRLQQGRAEGHQAPIPSQAEGRGGTPWQIHGVGRGCGRVVGVGHDEAGAANAAVGGAS